MKSKYKNISYIILIVFFAVVFLVTSVLFKVFGITNIWSQITGTLLGTIITAIGTVSLLNVQTNKEISHDRDVGIFEEKQKVYHKFIETLEDITQDGKVNIPSKDNPDKNDELQHLIYQLGFVQMSDTESSRFNINSCNLMAFSFSFDFDFLTFLAMFDKHNIPYKSKQRNEDYPLICAGGPVVTANPEPYKDIFDFFIIGDGEDVTIKLTNIIKNNKDKSKSEILKLLSKLEGIYVPNLNNKK